MISRVRTLAASVSHPEKKRRQNSFVCINNYLLALRQYYEKSSLAIFLSFVYLSSTLWGTPTTKVHDPVPWSDTIVGVPHRVEDR
jgi:hypothetical protein